MDLSNVVPIDDLSIQTIRRRSLASFALDLTSGAH
jgi:hypothetical protein